MRREDWLWLLLKAAATWLIVAAVETATDPTWSWFEHGEYDTAGKDQVLLVVIPLAIGALLLLTTAPSVPRFLSANFA